MTLEEAIIHAEDVSRSCNSECGKEHRQLANWLKDLVKYQWTPCSDRLPDSDQLVLITDIWGGVDITQYNAPKSDSEHKLYPNGYFGSDGSVDYVFRDMIAWMPCPEPYKFVED